MKAFSAFWLGAALLSGTTLAGAIPGTQLGDGDPFPVSCTNFTGAWRSDEGGAYFVDQEACKSLRIRRQDGGGSQTFAITPDDVSRDVQEGEASGTVRQRWNSRRVGNVVETHRTMLYGKRRKVTELVTLEEVSENLLAECTYRVIEEEARERRYETVRRLYRRASY